MKKLLFICALALFCATFSVNSLAQPAEKAKKPAEGTVRRPPVVSRERRMQGMMRMLLLSSKVVATPDGGAIVMVGNKLLKYDRNLRLIREAEFEIKAEEAQQMLTGK